MADINNRRVQRKISLADGAKITVYLDASGQYSCSIKTKDGNLIEPSYKNPLGMNVLSHAFILAANYHA